MSGGLTRTREAWFLLLICCRGLQNSKTGKLAVMQGKVAAAHHEAAHVVAAIRLGFPVTEVQIHRNDETGEWGGRAGIEMPPDWQESGWVSQDPEEIERIRAGMLVAYAGSACEKEILGTEPWYPKWQADSFIVMGLLGRVTDDAGGQGDEQRKAHERADEFVRSEADEITRFASVLLETESLDQEEILQVVRPSDLEERPE